MDTWQVDSAFVVGRVSVFREEADGGLSWALRAPSSLVPAQHLHGVHHVLQVGIQHHPAQDPPKP